MVRIQLPAFNRGIRRDCGKAWGMAREGLGVGASPELVPSTHSVRRRYGAQLELRSTSHWLSEEGGEKVLDRRGTVGSLTDHTRLIRLRRGGIIAVGLVWFVGSGWGYTNDTLRSSRGETEACGCFRVSLPRLPSGQSGSKSLGRGFVRPEVRGRRLIL